MFGMTLRPTDEAKATHRPLQRLPSSCCFGTQGSLEAHVCATLAA